MSRLNTARKYPVQKTHEGGPAARHVKPMEQLRRSVLSCLLWENEAYEGGQLIADRIAEFAERVSAEELSWLAIQARTTYNLRHVPLLLLDVLSKTGPKLMASTTAAVIQRPDEMAELLAVYWRNGRKMLPRQMRKGLAAALAKFDEYQLAKYDRDGEIKLRDVLRMARPKPENRRGKQSKLWKKVVQRELETPDTWEVALSGGADKRETFERLIREGNLGYLALLRNLRNMAAAGVDMRLVRDAIVARKNGAHRVFPFRYVAAARAVPQLEPAIDKALCAAIAELPSLKGRTVVLIDVSGSMDQKLSAKSDLTRMDAAAALGAIVNADDLRLLTFSHHLVEVPARRGMAGVDAIVRSQPHGGTYLGQALQEVHRQIPHDRLIVITDEQSADRVPDPICKHAYMINVASAKNGVGYGKWVHIDGFSESVLRFIHEFERAE